MISVGCNDGDRPLGHEQPRACGQSLRRTGQPASGRKAGQRTQRRRTVTADGLVVGVCNAAGPGEREGFYAALPSIHALLDSKHLTSVYAKPSERAVVQNDDPARRSLPPIDVPPPSRPLPPMGDVAETLPGRSPRRWKVHRPR